MDPGEYLGDMNVFTNPERGVVILTIFSVNKRFLTCLDYVYKAS